MNYKLIALILLLIIPHPDFNACDSKADLAEEYITMESIEYRSNLALAVAMLIPDDIIRQHFMMHDYLIRRYAIEPSKWNDYQAHFPPNLINNAKETYEQLVNVLRRENWTEVAMVYGVLAHWIGDLSDPFNVNSTFDNDTYYSAIMYEAYLNVTSGAIFSNLLQISSALDLKIAESIDAELNKLLVFAKSRREEIIKAIRENNTALLEYNVRLLSEKALLVLYGILMKALTDSGISTVNKTILRWWHISFAAIIVSIIVIIFAEVWKKRRVRL